MYWQLKQLTASVLCPLVDSGINICKPSARHVHNKARYVCNDWPKATDVKQHCRSASIVT